MILKSSRPALAHFDTVLVDQPNQPGVNWYRGVVLWYLNRHREAEEAWATAFKTLDPASQDAAFVKEALQKLRAGDQRRSETGQILKLISLCSCTILPASIVAASRRQVVPLLGTSKHIKWVGPYPCWSQHVP